MHFFLRRALIWNWIQLLDFQLPVLSDENVVGELEVELHHPRDEGGHARQGSQTVRQVET